MCSASRLQLVALSFSESSMDQVGWRHALCTVASAHSCLGEEPIQWFRCSSTLRLGWSHSMEMGMRSDGTAPKGYRQQPKMPHGSASGSASALDGVGVDLRLLVVCCDNQQGIQELAAVLYETIAQIDSAIVAPVDCARSQPRPRLVVSTAQEPSCSSDGPLETQFRTRQASTGSQSLSDTHGKDQPWVQSPTFPMSRLPGCCPQPGLRQE